MAKNDMKPKKQAMSPSKRRTRIRVMIGRIIFTVFLLAYMGVFYHYANYGYDLLMDWLVRLEASQPDVRSQQVFEELFSDPDWEELYHMAGEEDTVYEGAEAYATYMDTLVGDSKLTYVETSAGLSGNKKYIVKADNTKVAEFTLKNLAPEDEEIPDWTLDEVFVFYTRQESLTIFTIPGHTVYINGVALDTEAHLIQTTETVAETHLPEGLHGYRDMTLYFDGLLIQPEVTILDADGNAMEVSYDPATNLYAEVLSPAEQISQEMQDIIVEAGKAYGKYMIGAIGKNTLKNHFFASGQAYSSITGVDRFMQNYKNYSFGDPSVTEYYRYSDELISAYMSIVLNVTRTDGTIKEYYLETTFFLKPDETGKWMVDSMTNVHIQETVTMVKISFFNGSQEIASQWVNATASQIELPAVTVPSGKDFLGWYTKTVDGLDISYTLVFRPSETGVVILPEEYVLTPLVLYAQFG